MLATMRRKTRNAKMKNELGQGVEHLKRAVTLAAQETGATVGPKLHAAKDRVQPTAVKAKDSWDHALASLTPLVATAAENMRQSGKDTKKSIKRNTKDQKKVSKHGTVSKLAGLALIGAALGLGAAYVAKRRRAAEWDEYDPATPINPPHYTSTEDAAFEPIKPAVYPTPTSIVADPNRTNPKP